MTFLYVLNQKRGHSHEHALSVPGEDEIHDIIRNDRGPKQKRCRKLAYGGGPLLPGSDLVHGKQKMTHYKHLEHRKALH